MKNLFLFLLPAFLSVGCAQTLTPEALIQKSIQYHDPNGNWEQSDLLLSIRQERPDTNAPTVSYVHINNKNGNFELTKMVPGGIILQGVQDGQCIQKYNGEPAPDDIAEKYRLSCERSTLFRNYYTYLYGLPMKLRDPGTHYGPVLEMPFQGQDYYAIRVTYDEAVGKDIWYFFFDKENYALRGYKFHKDESKNDGEYITLEGEEIANGIRIPKKRAWYYNQDGKYLGTDLLVTAKSF
ncbi:MAG: hypothetical protein D6714_12945 [Bacteroidetes bacterium]|nr:MAG: hypothetical protein D6714_12945 [Bacteroidota bacterium]